MRVNKFAAHYMLSSDGKLHKWPLITLQDDGLILETDFFSNGFVEKAGTVFFAGILAPAFIDLSEPRKGATLLAEKYRLNRHFSHGTLAMRISGADESLMNRRQIPLFLSHVDDSMLNDGCVTTDINPDATLWERLKANSEVSGNLRLEEILTHCTLNAADVAGLSKAGSLTPGNYPGLLLLQNADLINLNLTPLTTVKWLNVPNPEMIR